MPPKRQQLETWQIIDNTASKVIPLIIAAGAGKALISMDLAFDKDKTNKGNQIINDAIASTFALSVAEMVGRIANRNMNATIILTAIVWAVAQTYIIHNTGNLNISYIDIQIVVENVMTLLCMPHFKNFFSSDPTVQRASIELLCIASRLLCDVFLHPENLPLVDKELIIIPTSGTPNPFQRGWVYGRWVVRELLVNYGSLIIISSLSDPLEPKNQMFFSVLWRLIDEMLFIIEHKKSSLETSKTSNVMLDLISSYIILKFLCPDVGSCSKLLPLAVGKVGFEVALAFFGMVPENIYDQGINI